MKSKSIWKYIMVIGSSLISITYISIEKEYVTIKKQAVKSLNIKDFKKRENNVLLGKNRLSCPENYFKISGMAKCHKWLDCKEIVKMTKNRKKFKKIGQGQSKKVYRVSWRNSSLHFALSVTAPARKLFTQEENEKRINIGKQNLLSLQSYTKVVQMIGQCNNNGTTMFLTEDCSKYGSLLKLVKSKTILSFSALERLHLVIQIIECFVFLHYESGLPKVNCDLHNSMQALRQFLLTNDKKVVLNDLDELPIDDKISNNIASCLPEPRCMMSDSIFLAPEQRYSKTQCKANKNFKTTSTIKSDTWKIPDISGAILNETFTNDSERFTVQTINKQLKFIHQKCKIANITKRANSSWILNEYLKVYNKANFLRL